MSEKEELPTSEVEEQQVVSEEAAEAVAESQQAAEDVQAKMAELEAKAQENWEHYVRTKAEMENIRRRAERDLENAHKFALERFAQELLPIKDSLEMGVAAAQSDDTDVAKLREGSELTLKMLDTAMEKFNIKVVDPLDQPFDPELHQAMSMIEVAGKEPNTVINVMQKGYTLNERLIRPAMVVVSKAASEQAGEPGANVDEQA